MDKAALLKELKDVRQLAKLLESKAARLEGKLAEDVSTPSKSRKGFQARLKEIEKRNA